MVDARIERRRGFAHRRVGGGIGVGTVVALILSWYKWHSIFWLIIHGILGWVYVIYYLFVYGLPTNFRVR